MEVINVASILFIGGETYKWMNNNDHIPIILQGMSPAVISFEQHSLLYEYDMTIINKLSDDFEKQMNEVNDLCKNENSVTCKGLMLNLGHNFKIMKDRENKIGLKDGNRKTRSINPFKKIRNFIDDKVTNIKDRIKTHIIHEISINATKEILNKTIENESQHKNHSDTPIEKKLQYFKQIMTLELSEHTRLTTTIINMLNSNHQFASNFNQLISIEEFRNDVQALSSSWNKKLETKFEYKGKKFEFASLEQVIFDISHISTEIMNATLGIQFTFPIWIPIPFKLFKIVPIPITIYNQAFIVQTNNKYLAISPNETMYYITENDIKNAKNSSKIILLSPESRIKSEETCEFLIMRDKLNINNMHLCDFQPIYNTNYFISLWRQMFYIHFSHYTKIHMKCYENKTETFRTKNSGVLVVTKHCFTQIDKIEYIPEVFYENSIRDATLTRITLNEIIENITYKRVTDEEKQFLNSKNENFITSDAFNFFEKLVDKIKCKRSVIKIETKHEQSHIENFKSLLIILGIVTTVVLLMTISILYAIYRKFKSIDWWIKITNSILKNHKRTEGKSN